MSSARQDKIKGRIKEAVGALTGDNKLKREGRKDQTAAKAKEKAEKAIDETRDASR